MSLVSLLIVVLCVLLGVDISLRLRRGDGRGDDRNQLPVSALDGVAQVLGALLLTVLARAGRLHSLARQRMNRSPVAPCASIEPETRWDLGRSISL